MTRKPGFIEGELRTAVLASMDACDSSCEELFSLASSAHKKSLSNLSDSPSTSAEKANGSPPDIYAKLSVGPNLAHI
jgi:hypothetical protein